MVKVFRTERLKTVAIEVEKGVGSHSQIDVSHHWLIEQHAKELRLATGAGGHIVGAEADLVPACVMPEVLDTAAARIFYINKNCTETACTCRRRRARNGETLTDKAIVKLVRGIILHDKDVVGAKSRELACGAGVNAGEPIATHCIRVFE